MGHSRRTDLIKYVKAINRSRDYYTGGTVAVCAHLLVKVESEDDIPVEFDILKIIEKDETAQRQFLADMLADCPNREGALEFIDKFLHRVKELNPPTAEHSTADSKMTV